MTCISGFIYSSLFIIVFPFCLFDDYLFTIHDVQTLCRLSHAAALQVVIIVRTINHEPFTLNHRDARRAITEAEELRSWGLAGNLQVSLAGKYLRATR